MSVSLSQGLMVGQALAVLPISSTNCRALSTACGLAVASAALKLKGSPVPFSAASFALQIQHLSGHYLKSGQSQ